MSLTRHSSDLQLGRMIGREPRFVDVAVLVLLAQAGRQRRRVRERPGDTPDHGTEQTLEPPPGGGSSKNRLQPRLSRATRTPTRQWHGGCP